MHSAIKSEKPYKVDFSLIDKFKLFSWYCFVRWLIAPIFRIFSDKESYKKAKCELKESYLSTKVNLHKQKTYNDGIAYHKACIELIKNRLDYWEFEICNHQKKKDE